MIESSDFKYELTLLVDMIKDIENDDAELRFQLEQVIIAREALYESQREEEN